MPVFNLADTEQTEFAFVSYKGAYSLFETSERWRFIGIYPNVRLAVHVWMKHPVSRTWLVVRNPYERIVSCFKDKFRKEPQRINEDGFYWQDCHRLILNRLSIAPNAPDTEKANALLEFDFSTFIEMLPEIYKQDAHFHPQVWLTKLHWKQFRFGNWRRLEIVHLEDNLELNKIPGINATDRPNSTSNIMAECHWNNRTRRVVNSLYREDFSLGSYSTDPNANNPESFSRLQ